MAQRDVTQSATFAAGFDFARRLRDPDFRAVLNQFGTTGRHTVIALDDEPVSDVIMRISFHDTGGRALIAIPAPEARFGFRMMGVEVIKGEPPAHVETIHLGPGASVGMLYAHLQGCGMYLPNEWTRDLLFERVTGEA